METLVPDQLATLGHPHRLDLFRLLMRRYPDRVPAGELAQALGIKASTMSTYLAALQQAGLITQTRAGTSLLYTIDMTRVQQMFDALFLDCCRGRPELCQSPEFSVPPNQTRKYNVLFLCTGNSTRSIFAEALLRDMAGDRFSAWSAGTRPRGELNALAAQMLEAKGHDTSALRTKSIKELSTPDAPQFDFIFTVCNQAANEDCATWDGQPISSHWGMEDPVAVTGTPAEKSLAFHRAYGILKRRIETFAALPVESLDRISLQRAIDDIGRTSTKEIA